MQLRQRARADRKIDFSNLHNHWNKLLGWNELILLFRYVYCFRRSGTLSGAFYNCPGTTLFNNQTGYCVNPSSYSCPTGLWESSVPNFLFIFKTANTRYNCLISNCFLFPFSILCEQCLSKPLETRNLSQRNVQFCLNSIWT